MKPEYQISESHTYTTGQLFSLVIKRVLPKAKNITKSAIHHAIGDYFKVTVLKHGTKQRHDANIQFIKSTDYAVGMIKKEMKSKQFDQLLIDSIKEDLDGIKSLDIMATKENIEAAKRFFGEPSTDVAYPEKGTPGHCINNALRHKNPWYGLGMCQTKEKGKVRTMLYPHCWNVENGKVIERTPGWKDATYFGKPLNLKEIKGKVCFSNMKWPKFVKDAMKKQK